jgi:protein-ribulosamine 3-kinase
MMWDQISQQIALTTGEPFTLADKKSVAGGCINSAYVVTEQNSKQKYFVKINSASQLPMFEAEFAGLEEINKTNTIQVPNPLCVGEEESNAFIVMEYLDIGHASGRQSNQQLAQDLAKLHYSSQTNYGWFRNNTIGSTPQINDVHSDWAVFFRDNRLRFQLDLAAKKGFRGALSDRGELLLNKVDLFFDQYKPVASLLHGDLWSGNYSVTVENVPVIFDPAVYYGDREADIAMTELFGGFSKDFYSAYDEAYPLDAGYPVRKTLYNLYHILNHLNLFGGGYLSQSEQMIDQLLSEVN